MILVYIIIRLDVPGGEKLPVSRPLNAYVNCRVAPPRGKQIGVAGAFGRRCAGGSPEPGEGKIADPEGIPKRPEHVLPNFFAGLIFLGSAAFWENFQQPEAVRCYPFRRCLAWLMLGKRGAGGGDLGGVFRWPHSGFGQT